MRIAYFDCFAGISGDMALGALIDAGADAAALLEGLRTLALPAWELQIARSSVQGISATDIEVIVGGQPARDAIAVHPPAPHEDHAHHAHPRHDAEHTHHHDHGPSRTLGEILQLIRESGLPPEVKNRGAAIFQRLAEAEARVHDATAESVHFHEVGAVDSIVDILGTVFALHLLDVERVVASPLPTGHGFIRTAHGLLPVPAPATVELLLGLPLKPVDVEGELVTPTGAALLASLAAAFGTIPAMRLQQVGYGAGKRRFAFPNVLRVMIGEVDAPGEATEVALLEANIDDMSPQLYEAVMERLFEAGALDVFLQPIIMKKGRPAAVLSVLAAPDASDRLADIVLAETTTLGVRESRLQRRCLEREQRLVETPYGAVRVKIGWLGDRATTVMPEYEDCRRLALETSVPLKEIQAAALCAVRGVNNQPPKREETGERTGKE